MLTSGPNTIDDSRPYILSMVLVIKISAKLFRKKYGKTIITKHLLQAMIILKLSSGRPLSHHDMIYLLGSLLCQISHALQWHYLQSCLPGSR